MHPAGNGISVLHVDASPELLDASRSTLPQVDQRIEVTTVRTASEAMDVLDAADVDCVVAEYALPGTDGVDLLEEVRSIYPDLPFIVYTGQGSEGVAADAISAGVTDYLQRSDGREDWTVLGNRIVNAVERRRAEQRATRSQSHLQALTAHTNDVILTVDDDGDVEYANHAVEDVFGYEPTCLEGQPLSLILPDGCGDDPTADGFDVAQACSDHGGVDLTGRSRDGDEVPLSASFSTFSQGGERYYAGILRDVSHQRELERKLRETANLYRALVEQSFVGILLIDEDGYRYVNPTAAEMLGYTQEEMAAKDPREVIVPEEREAVAERLRRRLDGDSDPSRYTMTALHRDGHRVHLQAHATPVEYQGEPAVITAIVDVTEERERKRRLAESERRYRTIVENFPNGSVGLFNSDLRYETVAGMAFEDLENDPEDMIGERIDEVHSQDFIENCVDHYEAVFDGESRVFEFEYADGMLARGRVIPLYNGDEVVNGLAMLQDVTEERERKRRLAESERRYRTMAEQFPNGSVGLFTPDLRYELINGEVFEELDTGPKEMEGELLQAVRNEVLVENYLDRYEAVFDGDPQVFEFEYEGEAFRTRLVPVYDGDEVVSGLEMTQNVTEEHERRQELEHQNARLERLAELLSTDLQQPLSALEEALSGGRDGVELAEAGDAVAIESGESEAIREVERARDALERLTCIADDLLETATSERPTRDDSARIDADSATDGTASGTSPTVGDPTAPDDAITLDDSASIEDSADPNDSTAGDEN